MFALPLLLFFLSFLLVIIGLSSPSDGSDGISPLGRELPSPIGVGFLTGQWCSCCYITQDRSRLVGLWIILHQRKCHDGSVPWRHELNILEQSQPLLVQWGLVGRMPGGYEAMWSHHNGFMVMWRANVQGLFCWVLMAIKQLSDIIAIM